MSIAERCVLLCDALKESDEAETSDFTIESLAPLAEELRNRLDGLQKEKARAAVAGFDLDEGLVRGALTSLGKVQRRLATDPGLLVRGTTFSDLNDRLKGLVRETRRTTNETRDELHSKWSNVGIEYLEVFAAVPELEAKCKEGLRLAKYVRFPEVLRATQTPEGLADFLEKGKRLEEIVAMVNDFECPKAVRQFLDRARKNGAPLSMVVPEVRAWLEDNDLLGKLKVRLV
jgi:hypothetical protein